MPLGAGDPSLDSAPGRKDNRSRPQQTSDYSSDRGSHRGAVRGRSVFEPRFLRALLVRLFVGLLGSIALIGLPDSAGAAHLCADQFDSCTTEAEDTLGRCVTSCPPDDGRCQTSCQDDFDLTLGQCVEVLYLCLGFAIDTKECGQSCREGGIRCDRRATEVRTRCKESCQRSFQGAVDRCRASSAKPGPASDFAACVASAQATRRSCEDDCHDERIDDLALCTKFEDSCEQVYCVDVDFAPEPGELRSATSRCATRCTSAAAATTRACSRKSARSRPPTRAIPT
jgi:hypothetical protein